MSREADINVATKVLGLTVDGEMYLVCKTATGQGWNSVRNYTTDPIADYEVLKHVRETWTKEMQNEMGEKLFGMWGERRGPEFLAMNYEPGDYARSVLKVIEG